MGNPLTAWKGYPVELNTLFQAERRVTNLWASPKVAEQTLALSKFRLGNLSFFMHRVAVLVVLDWRIARIFYLSPKNVCLSEIGVGKEARNKETYS
jgi:hypothetical protein